MVSKEISGMKWVNVYSNPLQTIVPYLVINVPAILLNVSGSLCQIPDDIQIKDRLQILLLKLSELNSVPSEIIRNRRLSDDLRGKYQLINSIKFA